MIDLHKINKEKFTNLPYLLKINKPWGHEFIFTPTELPYVGKILHIKAGKRLSLQIHEKKQESCFLLSGRCNLVIEGTKGDLETIEIKPENGYTIKPGQKHRYHAITDCNILEVSTPEVGVTYRLEDDYGRPDETQTVRIQERNSL